MREVSLYDSTGRIHTILTGDAVGIQNTLDNITDGWVEGAWDTRNKYVSNGEVFDRPANPTTQSGLTLSNVPVPSTLQIGNQRYETNEPTVELEFNLPGTYVVKVFSWPYLDKEFTVENPAP